MDSTSLNHHGLAVDSTFITAIASVRASAEKPSLFICLNNGLAEEFPAICSKIKALRA
ncbi:hypothetical protein VCRA2128O305_310040 [Vibrio crassostreae]|nr:hypothetical protein VCRA2112O187_140007 [Vibrio crassostreae]CAK1944899.1 hypothetical protein VCRA2112O188_250007 [Vibrio crassostreae]CAK1945093.1 hypothetical protein VCRA2112O192_260006 [Vibrio crassostreae]CAK1946313.1 hypothetical protein VCRA2113O227_250007 [Vibrio crassostreae]CAK1949459.1 hypothetical protein VCRA2113O222_280031 [Vibrio crassostreae]